MYRANAVQLVSKPAYDAADLSSHSCGWDNRVRPELIMNALLTIVQARRLCRQLVFLPLSHRASLQHDQPWKLWQSLKRQLTWVSVLSSVYQRLRLVAVMDFSTLSLLLFVIVRSGLLVLILWQANSAKDSDEADAAQHV